MATAIPNKPSDDDIRNITSCLQFLVNESLNCNLLEVSKIISNAIMRINYVESQFGQELDPDYAELLSAFKAFVKANNLDISAMEKSSLS